MAVKHEWKIAALECYPKYQNKTNVVFCVMYERRAIASPTASVSFSGACDLDTANLSSFVAYNDLSKDIVVSWLESALGAERLRQIAAELDAALKKQAAPDSITPLLPWSE